MQGIAVKGIADIHIEPAIEVQVYQAHPRRPEQGIGLADARGPGGVFEFQVAPVQVQGIVDLVPGQEDIVEAVSVQVAQGHPATVVHEFVVEDVDGVVFVQAVFKRDTRAFGSDTFKQGRGAFFVGTRCNQNDHCGTSAGKVPSHGKVFV